MTTVTGQLALVIAAAFTGAAFYINWAEQPARLKLDDKAALTQWKPSYHAGFSMQAPLAIAGFILAAMTWMHGETWLWLAGGLVLAANWPFTLAAIMPVNAALTALAGGSGDADGSARALLQRWGRLHGVRTLLGALASTLMLFASFMA
jgi:uncharacterized membrane protein